MRKIIISILAVGLLLISSVISTNALDNESDDSEDLSSNMMNNEYPMVSNDEPFDGYILFNTMFSPITYLMDSNKEIVRRWLSIHPALTAYLQQDGNLLRACQTFNSFFSINGQTGRIEMLSWNGMPLWEFRYSNNQHCLHHDIVPLPNGHVLMTAWERKLRPEAIAAGYNPQVGFSGNMVPDYIIEVEPTGLFSGNIVWEWHVWDHLIQDFDSSKANYGVVKDHPELIDINLLGFSHEIDWLHINSIDYNEELDQILLSSYGLSEIFIIDHSTTTQQAATHAGGNSGKGGDILYRWGNPQNYRRGDENNRTLFGQHNARWIKPGCPGEGHITVFNNQLPNSCNSSVDEIVTPMDENGNYYLGPSSSYHQDKPGLTYGPENATWRIISGEEYSGFASSHFSGAQRLPNGNTLICRGNSGKFFVVTPNKNLVWETDTISWGIFNMCYYPLDYTGIGDLSINSDLGLLEVESISKTVATTQNSQSSE